MIFFTILSALLFAALSNASPTSSQNFIVYSPHITSPKASTTWALGSTHNITWETSDIPHEKRGSNGLILLGYVGNGASEHLDIDHPLASSFPIEKGYVLVRMPKNTPCRNDYFIVLFGDSGNKSPKFRVTKH
ncbi:hypothetical protein BDZ94DRAFT_1296310 [Collybia nuda]|uniref:Uncharacterized protein n=1 Tax=Collybia nuda TaxID=64659 RepID=A0A9P5Y927_9AGAR|nr:hypothetical protein BDZ94DRAFT_1296310 [Collybia nuda]